MDSYDAYKDKIGQRVTLRLEQAIKNQEVSEGEGSEISSYILDNIDLAKNNIEIFDFLEALAKKWPIFTSIIAADNEVKAVEEVQGLIKENKLDEALKVAENATDQSVQQQN